VLCNGDLWVRCTRETASDVQTGIYVGRWGWECVVGATAQAARQRGQPLGPPWLVNHERSKSTESVSQTGSAFTQAKLIERAMLACQRVQPAFLPRSRSWVFDSILDKTFFAA
jgi:hypothetical protein